MEQTAVKPFSGQPIAQEQNPYFARDFFVYEVDVLALGPGQSTTQTFTIQADSDFLWTKGAYYVDNGSAPTASTRILPQCTVLIQDTGSGRNLMSSAVPVSSLFGTGELPMILPRQRLFVARAQVQVVMSNFNTVDTYNMRLSFIGEKAFRR
jgi:hypothetical protein